MKTLIFIFLFVSLASLAGAQTTSYPLLSQKQMYQDYDTLVNTLLQVSPQPAFRKKLTGFDIVAFYHKNRLKIKAIKTPEAFYQLVRSTLAANQDSHTGLLRPGMIPAAYLKSQGISDAAIAYSHAYSAWYAAPANANHFNFQFRYVNGRYYNMQSFIYQNKFYKAGLELTDCNGQPINSYVNRLQPYLNMKWDVVHHRYYADNFFKAFNLSAGDVMKLKFKDIPAARTFRIADSVTFAGKGNAVAMPVKEVVYFAGLKVLYIRMPAMELADSAFYPEQIMHYRNEPIRKVVIDIRGNRGGGDGVWRNALSAIIDKPVIISETIIMNQSEKIRQLFAGQFDPSKTIRVPFLNNKIFYISYQGTDTIPKGNSSINYGGKIYILQDSHIYSSAGAFAAFGNLVKNFYTVGELTGAQLGIGVNPAVFELPNSRVIYRVEPVIDYTGVKKPSDILHDQVKIPVILDLNGLLNIVNNPDRYSGSFLLQKDPWFKAVLMH